MGICCPHSWVVLGRKEYFWGLRWGLLLFPKDLLLPYPQYERISEIQNLKRSTFKLLLTLTIDLSRHLFRGGYINSQKAHEKGAQHHYLLGKYRLKSWIPCWTEDSGSNGISVEGADKGLFSFRSGQVLLLEVSCDWDTWSAGFFLALTNGF